MAEKYLKKIEGRAESVLWNLPEQKQGIANVIGGNSEKFRTAVKTAEFLTANYPIKEVRLTLPDALSRKLPNLPNFQFLESTETGSFGDEKELAAALNTADFNLMIGDFSRNAITGKAVQSACLCSEKPTILTRDCVDILAENCTDSTLMNENLILLATMAQIIKIFRAVYYPKMVTLTESLVQVAEALHKFTLSYPTRLITFHSGQVLIAENGEVALVPLDKTLYSPISLWSGEAAAKILALNLYNPGKFIDASSTALFRV